MFQSQLSVIMRAAEAYAEGDDNGLINSAIASMYADGNVSFIISAAYPIPLHLFSPRLRSFLLEDKDKLGATDIWNIISSRDSIIKMITATEMDRTAAESLSSMLHKHFPLDANNELNMKRKQMIGYMVKIVMELFGYGVYQQRMQISLTNQYKNEERVKNYFATASRYKKIGAQDIENYVAEIENRKTKEVVSDILTMIKDEKTDYQKYYSLNRLETWDKLCKKDN
ncbi:MAG: hypothetical protein PHY48_10310 [Candidatus Cloacimonetes bacterium]|nr:hypothetical protein [Candidatus Cloacimonadota bacterium]